MNVTDGDRERARQVIDALSPEAAYVDEFVYDGDVQPLHEAIAAALAEEREKARAPFLALAVWHDVNSDYLAALVDSSEIDERDQGFVSGRAAESANAAERIRHAAQEQQ